MTNLPAVLIPHPHVRVTADILSGSPCVAGSRVPVRRIWTLYRDGFSVERVNKRFPKLGPAKVFDAISFALDNPEVMAADIEREQAILNGSSKR